MICPKCNSQNVNVQVVNEVKLKNQHRSLIWWLIIGWWWIPVKWIYFTLFALIFKLFSHKKQKAINKQVKTAVCQNCGNTWRI